jgi:H+-translocating diphosphatase
MLFPLLISAFGIVICIITSFVATNLTKVDQVEKIEATLKNQLLISTILMTPAIFGAGYLTLPEYFLYDTTKIPFDFLNNTFILDNMNKCW